jgi:hypothetical protein
VSVGVSGSGFAPGELVFAQIPAPGGLAGFAEATVAPDGTVNTTIEHVFPGGIDPVAVPERRQGRPHLQARQGLGPLRHPPRQIAPLPGHGPSNAKYKVQFDDSKKLSKKASLKIVTGLGSTF